MIYAGLVVVSSGSTTTVRRALLRQSPPVLWQVPHLSDMASTSPQLLLLAAVVANLHFAAGLTHAWYTENVPVRPEPLPCPVD